ncbi:MAG: hypothetical protein VYA30_03290 [Myxococcota bacterium]|nr:hypothetical protein [Myxococcota bacterium]
MTIAADTQDSNHGYWVRNSRTKCPLMTLTGMGVVLVWLSMGCAGSPRQSQSPIKEPAPLPALTQLIESRMAAQAQKALVTMALFGGSELDDEDRLKRRLGQFTARYRARGKAVPKLTEISVVTRPIEASLPFDLNSLASQAGDAKKMLVSATQVVFVRFKGSPLPHNEQIHFVLSFVDSLTEGSNQAVVDFSTRRAYTQSAFNDWVARDKQLADQVTPGIEQSADGVTFFTRGFAKFGHPDLEVYGIPPKMARQHFPRFQAAIDAHRNGSFKKVGDTFRGTKLAACKRDGASYELNCVRLPVKADSATPKSGAQ